MILAAGRGTRLGSRSTTVPKCMTVIEGRPVLEHVIAHLAQFDVHDVVINLHHLPEAVVDHFGDGTSHGVQLTWSYEPELLGTAGAVRNVRDHFDGPFFVWYGDNLSDINLERLAQQHSSRSAVATVALHYRDDVTQSGIVGLGRDDRILRFLEKPNPEQVFSHWVNAGVYILAPDVLDLVPEGVASDFGRDVLPSLVESGGSVYGYRMGPEERLRWIDTPADLARETACEEPADGSVP